MRRLTSFFVIGFIVLSPYILRAEEVVRIQSIASSKCLDVPNLSTDNHVKIQQYSCRGANDSLVNAQLWRLKSVNGLTQIESVTSGKCLDVPDLSTANNVIIQQYACRGANDSLVNAQLWRLDKMRRP